MLLHAAGIDPRDGGKNAVSGCGPSRAGLVGVRGRRVGAERPAALRKRYQAPARGEEIHLRQRLGAGLGGLRAERRGGRDTGQSGDGRPGQHGQDRQGDRRRARLRPPEEGRLGRRAAALRQAQDRGHDGRRHLVHGAHPLRRAESAGRPHARLSPRHRHQGAHAQQARSQPARRSARRVGAGAGRHQRQVEPDAGQQQG